MINYWPTLVESPDFVRSVAIFTSALILIRKATVKYEV